MSWARATTLSVHHRRDGAAEGVRTLEEPEEF
jgi:hypothetical protein